MPLKVYIVDETCGEDEAYHHTLPGDTSQHDIITAISVFYPTATSITIEAVPDEEDAEDVAP